VNNIIQVKHTNNNKQGWIERFLEASTISNGWRRRKQAGGSPLMKEAKESDKSLNIDASGMTADYKYIIDHADNFLEMLGHAVPGKRTSRQVGNKNIPKQKE